MVSGQKSLVAQMVHAPGVFRARPGELEEEDDYQEEEYAEEGYCECDEEAQEEGAGTQFRLRPRIIPVGALHHPIAMKPKVVVLPPKPVMVPKRSPVPKPGFNTYQPKVFSTRPLDKPIPVAHPMGTLKPASYGMPTKVMRPPVVVPGPKKGYRFILRRRKKVLVMMLMNMLMKMNINILKDVKLVSAQSVEKNLNIFREL